MERKTYKYDEVLKATLDYFGGDTLSTSSWIRKYALSDVGDDYENIDKAIFYEKTPNDMHMRMAKEFARIEKQYPINNSKIGLLSDYGKKRKPLTEERIFELFKGFGKIVPQGSVMAGLGGNAPVSFSNCFVIPSPEDTVESIMNTGRDKAQIFKRRGGVGFDISKIRPAGSNVNNAAKSSSGSISFMHLYSTITEVIGQEGRRKKDETFFNIENIQSKYYGQTNFNRVLRKRNEHKADRSSSRN